VVRLFLRGFLLLIDRLAVFRVSCLYLSTAELELRLEPESGLKLVFGLSSASAEAVANPPPSFLVGPLCWFPADPEVLLGRVFPFLKVVADIITYVQMLKKFKINNIDKTITSTTRQKHTVTYKINDVLG